MKVLIVDDNKNNRMILSLLLEDFMDAHKDIKLLLDEAEDGQIAVDKCRESAFDIVLMDIMMPNMDGIEATKIIRLEFPKTMIIAVSAVDDSQRQKHILNNGAEDYISKPVNPDIFMSRMSNYILLCEARKTKKARSDVVANLFTKDVFSRHTRFLITSEDALSEFWEYFLLSNEVKCDNLSDTVRTVFSIAEIQRRLNVNIDIFLEESESKKYFTITSIDEVPKEVIALTLKKNNFQGNYKIANSKISFELDVKFTEPEVMIDEVLKQAPITNPVPEMIPQPTTIVTAQIPAQGTQSTSAEVNIASSVSLKVFDYMDSDDLYDLEEYAGKLNSIMLIVGGDITEEEVVDIYTYLEKIGSVLATYGEVYPIAQALNNLSVDMSTYMQEFMDNSEALAPMCKAFSNDMSKWIEQSFHTGAPSADFMNDTIVVNCQTISGMLKMNDAPPLDDSSDFDDIFDF